LAITATCCPNEFETTAFTYEGFDNSNGTEVETENGFWLGVPTMVEETIEVDTPDVSKEAFVIA